MIRLAVRVAREHAELVLAELLELAPAGVEELDAGDGSVEYAVYGAPGELPALPDVRAAAGDALVQVSTTELPDDWGERWKQFHHPVLVRAPRRPPQTGAPPLPDLHLRPPWEAPPGRDDQTRAAGPSQEPLQIVIDPGQAFGTGAHATTRLCLELLLALAAEEGVHGPALDIGTGSGVLAIAAAKLGFRPVLALDNDPESVAAATHNARFNDVRMEVRRFDLREDTAMPPRAGTADDGPEVVTANLLRPLLLELAQRLARPPVHLLAGGLLVPECDEMATVFAARMGMREHRRLHSGEWGALWLTG